MTNLPLEAKCCEACTCENPHKSKPQDEDTAQ
jgi:hypothetical protein